MLRRKPTTITLTAADIEQYEANRQRKLWEQQQQQLEEQAAQAGSKDEKEQDANGDLKSLKEKTLPIMSAEVSQPATALQYELIKTYSASNFFDEFNFFSGQDPTGGFVQYTPFETAAATGLIGNATGQVFLGVDTVNVYPPGGPGRPSVRLESKLTFSEGLFVLNLSHLPTGCGTWPAFWTVGLGDWPADGEIDIIEGVNDATSNDASLHVDGDCTVSDAVAQTGTWKHTDCNVKHDGNQGCGTKFSDLKSFGEVFNQNGGGVYATEWTSSAVNVWFFPSDEIPTSLSMLASFDPSTSHPDPSTFGIPSASFAGPCASSFGEKLFNHTIVIDTTFCGGWAGGSFGIGDTKCPISPGLSSLDSCIDFVGNHPEAFTEAYWLLNNLRVWQKTPGFETSYYGSEPTADSDYMPMINDPVEQGLEEVENDIEVSPLTGGIITTDDELIRPIPIEQGIGDGSVLDTAEPILPVENDYEVSSLTGGVITTDDELIGTIPIEQGIGDDSVLDIAGPITEDDLIRPFDPIPIEPAIGDDSVLNTPESTIPIENTPIDTYDTTQSVGKILGLLDDTTTSQLLSALAQAVGIPLDSLNPDNIVHHTTDELKVPGSPILEIKKRHVGSKLPDESTMLSFANDALWLFNELKDGYIGADTYIEQMTLALETVSDLLDLLLGEDEDDYEVIDLDENDSEEIDLDNTINLKSRQTTPLDSPPSASNTTASTASTPSTNPSTPFFRTGADPLAGLLESDLSSYYDTLSSLRSSSSDLSDMLDTRYRDYEGEIPAHADENAEVEAMEGAERFFEDLEGVEEKSRDNPLREGKVMEILPDLPDLLRGLDTVVHVEEGEGEGDGEVEDVEDWEVDVQDENVEIQDEDTSTTTTHNPTHNPTHYNTVSTTPYSSHTTKKINTITGPRVAPGENKLWRSRWGARNRKKFSQAKDYGYGRGKKTGNRFIDAVTLSPAEWNEVLGRACEGMGVEGRGWARACEGL